jgi:V/A-type H+-transporting ATPase subunit D
MIYPTRTNLLQLKARARSVAESMEILKARRKALMKEFLSTTVPFLRSRKDISGMYGKALVEIALAAGHEGRETVESIALGAGQESRINIAEGSVWGVKFKDISVQETPVRRPDERNYDYRSTSARFEEAVYLFEKIVESVLQIATFESKLKRLGDEILRTTRRIKVLERRIQPALKMNIRRIAQYIEEREREACYRLKLWNSIR